MARRKSEYKNIKSLKEQLARALADYQNLQKRVEKEREMFIKHANQTLMEKLLPVLDMLEKADSYLQDRGLHMAVIEFKKVLEEAGVVKIEAKRGEKFDESIHEVVETVPGGKKGKKGMIAEVVRNGYRWQDGLVLRPAQVKVYDS